MCPGGDKTVPVCVWEMDGGRPCPLGYEDCSQPVYRCMRCGDYDYGEPGGPAYEECERCVRGERIKPC